MKMNEFKLNSFIFVFGRK